MKINSISPLYAYNFKSRHIVEHEKNSSVKRKSLCHYSMFFREEKADKWLINHLKNNITNRPINIISAGCSYGEETYSYALALDNEKYPPKILGVDLSKTAIESAIKGEFQLDSYEYNLLNGSFLMDENLKNSFQNNFRRTGRKTFLKKEGKLENCVFVQEDLRNVISCLKPQSQDLILCRNVLYHMTNKENKELLAKMYEALRPGGFISIGALEIKDYAKVLHDLGAKTHDGIPCIFQKPKE